MRAAVLHRPGDIRVEDVPAPRLHDNHALVRVASVGVCGSDLPRMLIKGAHRMPLICGHEFSGHVAEVGEGLEGFTVGDLVVVPPMLPCHACDQCLKGQFSRCRDYDYFGSRRDGAYAEYVSVPASNLLKVPAGADPRAVAMADPASIALHAIWKAGGIAVGQRGGVIGCGPIGLFAIQWMRLMGVSEVVAVDVSEHKLALAREAGATHTILAGDGATGDLPCDVIIEAAGNTAAIAAAVRLAAPGGHVVFIGIPVGEVALPNTAFQHFLRQEVSLHGSWNSFGAPFPGPQWAATLEALGTGRLKWEFLISHDLDLAELPGMFARFRDEPDMFYSKVMFRP
ncbi:galactitol-1-phosphate 5-dehydrogenase [Chelativorans alearense]|uniref:galactitol-1-phosphate 5-dehydrogenase n=1 Tax=Chelativorans alearense TaxID=2681495 RepID=UPI0013D60702|nr:galactitol-1-phosphate 5-dehydrogenase [Chelativorans alearense]